MKPHPIPFSSIIPSPLGPIGIVTHDNKLTSLEWLPDSTPTMAPQDPFTRQVAAEIEHYFTHPQHQFTFAVEFNGSDFQQKVWRGLLTIPYGKTLTYGEFAKQLNSGPRAIGQACRTNRIPLVIPCHRIVAANHLGGYAGATSGKLMNIKTWLLNHEKKTR